MTTPIVATCLGKTRFASREEAEAAARAVARRRRASRMRAYRCPFCAGYHLTNSTRGRRS